MATEAGPAVLDATQSELEAVKKALRESSPYLGMGGETLQRYLLQLMEKENLLLSHKLRAQQADSPKAEVEAPDEEKRQELITKPEAFINSSETNGQSGAEKIVPVAAAEDAGADAKPVEEPIAEPAEVTDVKPPPEGDVQPWDRESLPDVVRHLCDYEAVPGECAKSLRAISSLAYKNAASVGVDSSVVPQVLRVIDIHRKEDMVQVAAIRVLCNLAYAPEVALGVLAQPRVFAALLAGIGKDEKKEIGAKASEAVARIVAAESGPEEERPEAFKKPTDGCPGALAGLFVAAATGDPTWQGVATSLVLQLIANEVVEAPYIANRFVAAGAGVSGTRAIAGWLALAKSLALVENNDLPEALIPEGAIRVSIELMGQAPYSGRAQLIGIEAMSSLVGSRYPALQDFAKHRGMQLIEQAMETHVDEVLLQTKGIRALASGVAWPIDIQQASGFDVGQSIILTKGAMSRHAEDADLQVAALEALAKYVGKVNSVDEVRDGGGEGLVKAMMAKHKEVQKVQTWGRIVLDGIGGDRHWAPRGVAAK